MAKPAGEVELDFGMRRQRAVGRVGNCVQGQVEAGREAERITAGGAGDRLPARTFRRGEADRTAAAEIAALFVSREALRAAVTGHEADDKPTRAIDTCISRLRIKLRGADAGAEIRSVRQAGYLFRRQRAGRLSSSPEPRCA